MTQDKHITYRPLRAQELSPALLHGFDRTQQVTRCWRKEGGAWVIRDITFTERWDADALAVQSEEMRAVLQSGGAAFGAFCGDRLIGYATVDSRLIGSHGQYAQLKSLHVTRDMRGMGAGKRLFALACGAAKALGAQKLYLSAHSSVESQAFYKAVGCVEAAEYYDPAVSAEPFDCQLERDLAVI